MNKHSSTNPLKKNLNAKSRSDNKTLYSTFEHMAEACIVLNAEWHCTYANKKATAFFRKTAPEVSQKHIGRLFLTNVDSNFYQQCVKALAQKLVLEGEAYFPGLEKRITYRLYPSEQALLIFFSECVNKERLERKSEKAEVDLNNFRTAMDASSVVSIFDQKGKIIYANEQFCEISQYSPNEILGNSYELIQSGHHQAAFFQEIAAATSQGKTWKGEFCNKAKDGSLYWLDTTIVPFPDKHGQIKQYLNIQHDITARKKTALALKESEHLYRFLFENNSDAVLLIRPEGEILKANRVALNFLELPLSSVQQLNIFSFVREEDRQKLHEALQDPENKSWRAESTIHHKNNQTHVIVTLIPLSNTTKVRQFFIRIKDITARINQEKELAFLNNVTTTLSAADSLEAGMNEVIRLLCHFTGFQYGEYWMPLFGQKETRIKSYWSDNQSHYPFIDQSSKMTVGLNHKMTTHLRSGQVFHCPKLKDDTTLQRKLSAIQCGYQSYVAIPICYRHHYLGSFLLFSTQETPELSFNPNKIQEILIKLGGEVERRRKNEELNRFFNLSPDLLCILGFDGFIKKSNPSFKKLLGYNEQELFSFFFIDLVHPDEQQRLRHDREYALKGKAFINYELRIRCKDGSYRWLECNSYSIVEDGLSYIVARDISLHKTQIQQIEKLNRAVEESGNEIYIANTGSLKFSYANKQALNNLGYSLEELLKLGPDKVRFNSNTEEIKSLTSSLLNEECKNLRYNSVHVRKDGSKYPVEVHLSLFEHGDEKAFLAHVLDITERLKTEEALRVSNERYQLVTIATHDAIWDWDIRQDKVYWGKGFFTLFGYDLHNSSMGIEELTNLVHKEDAKIVIEDLFDVIHTPKNQWTAEYRHKCQDGSYKYVKNRAYLIYDAAGKAIRMTGAITDITEVKNKEALLQQFTVKLEAKVQKKTIALEVAFTKIKQEFLSRIKAERILQESIREKDVLIKEIHHRVKNNLAIVSSLLFLQARLAKHPEVKTLLKESQSRIKSMALIHELLYQNENLSRINFDTYIHDLTREMVSSFQNKGLLIEIFIEAEKIELDIIHAVPCSLILNELITNSFKYAFPGREKGEIHISFHQSGEICKLKVADNGIGLPAPSESIKKGSLGMQLVSSLVKQLGGDLSVRNNNGAVFEIKFSPSE